jgi:hypothetical protein
VCYSAVGGPFAPTFERITAPRGEAGGAAAGEGGGGGGPSATAAAATVALAVALASAALPLLPQACVSCPGSHHRLGTRGQS